MPWQDKSLEAGGFVSFLDYCVTGLPLYSMIMGRGGSFGKPGSKERDMKGWSQPGSRMFHSSPL